MSDEELNKAREDIDSQIDYWENADITYLTNFQRTERAQVLALAYHARERIEVEALRRRVASLESLVQRIDQKRSMRQML